MSALSEKIRVALFAKLNVVSVVGSGKASAVYHKIASESATFPYVIFQRFAAKDVLYSFGLTLQAEDDLWLVKCLADEDSSSSKEPEQLNEDILALCQTAIGSTLTISGGTVQAVYRIRDIPAYTEILNDRPIYHNGFLLRVVAN